MLETQTSITFRVQSLSLAANFRPSPSTFIFLSMIFSSTVLCKSFTIDQWMSGSLAKSKQWLSRPESLYGRINLDFHPTLAHFVYHKIHTTHFMNFATKVQRSITIEVNLHELRTLLKCVIPLQM